ncbi:MAG TPA: 6-phosphogluconolactonase [Nocardioidaceae bacterium]|nr:6-phosphogluconolactonase [Nocardioidaceae bacterium]
MGEPVVRRSATAQGLADLVAASLVDRLRDAQHDGRVPSVALTGGTIAATVHRSVAASPDAASVDWSRVEVFFGDERFVPADDPDRNALQATESLLSRLPFDPARIHPMPASDGAHPSVDDAARAYDEELRAHGAGGFDVVMLGVGPDGHVASLFPGHAQLDVEDAIAVPVADSPKPPPERVSLTFPALNRGTAVWFLVSGEGKAEAVARALATGPDAPDLHDVPAVGVHGRQETVWFLDEASASLLPAPAPGGSGGIRAAHRP